MSSGDPGKIGGGEDEFLTSEERLEMNSIASQAGSVRATPRKIQATNTADELYDRDDEPEVPRKTRSPLKVLTYTIAISFGILTLILLINGTVMAFGMYGLYKSARNNLTFDLVTIDGLDELAPLVSVDAKFPVEGLSKLVGFELKEGSKITIQSPQQVSSRLPRGASTLMTVDIPAVKIGRGSSGALSVHGIQAHINEEIPLSDLALWYMNAEENAVVNVKGTVKVFTWSFLIPISYNYNLNMDVPIKTKATKNEPAKQLVSMESLEFYEDNHKDRFRCLMGLNLKEGLVPSYVETKLPEFAFSVQNVIDPEYPETILQVYVKEQEISKDKPRNMQVHFEVNGAQQVDSLKAVLEYVRDKDYDFDLAVTGSKLEQGKEKKKPTKLQAWLSTLHVRAAASTMLSKQKKRIVTEKERASEINGNAVAALEKMKHAGLVVLGETRKVTQKIRQVSRQLFGQEEDKKPVDLAILFDEPETSDDIHPVSFGFVGLEGNADSPRFLFRFGFSTKFLYKITGINLGALKGKLPPIHLQNFLDRTIASAESHIGLADIKIEQERLAWPNEVRFLIRVDLMSASDILLVASKLFHQRRAHARGLSIDLSGLKSVSIGGSNENVLSSILSVFQVEWNFDQGRLGMKRGPRYHLDPADAEQKYEDSKKALKVGGYKLEVLEKEIKRVIHEATVELASDSNNISLTSKITLDKRPAINRNPYVYLYWESVYASIFPTRERQEMMGVRLKKGSFRVKMATGINPALLLFRGGLELVMSLSGPSLLDITQEEKSKTDLDLVRIWKDAYTNWAFDDSNLGLSVQIAVRNQSLNVDFDLPRKRDLLGAGSDRKDWTAWTERLIQSNFSLAGIHEGVLTFLVNLPEANRCEIMPDPKLKIIGKIRLPAFGLNVCADKTVVENREKEKEINNENLVCLFKVGLSKPIETELIFHDGSVCDVITRFVEDRETFIKHRKALLGERRKATRQGTQFDDRALHKAKHALALRNVIPMYFSILDLDSALNVAPDLFSHDMNKLLITAGYQDKKSYHDLSIPLIERFGNGFISAFQEYLPRWGQKGFKRARNVVERVARNLVMPTSVVVTSDDVNHMSCSITLNIPREAYGKNPSSSTSSSESMSDIKDEASTSFAEFMRVRWGKTEVNLRPVPYRDNQSYLQITLDQGQFYLNSQAAAAELTSSLDGTSNTLSMKIDMHAGPSNFSSSMLQTIKNYLVVAFNHKRTDKEFNYPTELVAVAEKIPEMNFQAELRSSIFRHDDGAFDSEEETRDVNEYTIARDFKGLFVINVMKQVYTIMQGKKKKEGEPQTVTPWDYNMVIEPRPFADKNVVNVPFLFDTNCGDPRMLMAIDDPKDRRIIRFNLRVHQLIHHVMSMFADNFAVVLKNIGLYRHPGKLLLTIKLPQMVLNGAVNGIDMVEATMQEFSLVRTLDLFYDMPGEAKKGEKLSLNDVEVLEGEARWGKNVRDFADIISPASIAMSMGVQVELKEQPKHEVDLQNMPMTMAFSNEHVDRAQRNLFTSMFCTWYGEHPISPMIREMSKEPGRIRTYFKDVNLERLVIEAQDVFIPWPVARIQVQVDKPVWIDFVSKECVFLAIKVNPLTLHDPETHIPKAVVTLSRTSFGALPVDRFSKTFADFIGGLVLGRALDFTIRVRIADDENDPDAITANIPFYLPQSNAKLAFFDTKGSEVLIGKFMENKMGSFMPAASVMKGVYEFFTGLGGQVAEYAKSMVSYENPKLDDSSKRLYPRSVHSDEEVGYLTEDSDVFLSNDSSAGDDQVEEKSEELPAEEGFFGSVYRKVSSAASSVVGGIAHVGSAGISTGYNTISRTASATYGLVSGGVDLVSKGYEVVRDYTVGKAKDSPPQIEDVPSEEPSLQDLVEAAAKNAPDMDKLVYPHKEDKGKEELVNVGGKKSGFASLADSAKPDKVASPEKGVLSSWTREKKPAEKVDEKSIVAKAPAKKPVKKPAKKVKPVKKSKVAQENAEKSDVAKTGTSRWWHKWIPNWFSSSTKDNQQAEVENTLDEYGNPKVEEVDSDDDEALNEPIKNDGHEGKAIVRTAPRTEKNQPLIKVNIPKANPDREQSLLGRVGTGLYNAGASVFSRGSNLISTSASNVVHLVTGGPTTVVVDSDDENALTVPQPKGYFRSATDYVAGGFSALGGAAQGAYNKVTDRLFTSKPVEPEANDGAPIADGMLGLLRHMQDQFKSKKVYDSGGAKWQSTYQDADLIDENMEDMTWLGFGDKTGPGFFGKMIKHTKLIVTNPDDEVRLNDIYALSFMNASPYSMAVVGQLLNLYFTDTDGLIARGTMVLTEKPEIPAKMQVLPKNCLWENRQQTPSVVAQLRCIHLNAGMPAVPCQPNSHHKGDARFLAPLTLKVNDLLLLADENFYHDGLCINIRDSYVVLGIFHPLDPTKYILLDLLLNMDDVETLDEKDPYGDPCGKVFRVIPDKQVLLWGRKRSKNFLAHPKADPRSIHLVKDGDAEWLVDSTQTQAFKLFFEDADDWMWKFYGYMTPTEFLWEIRDGEHYVIERGSIPRGSYPIKVKFTHDEWKIEVLEVKEPHPRILFSKKDIDGFRDTQVANFFVFSPNDFDIHEPALPAHSARFFDKHNGIHWETEPVNLDFPAVFTMNMKTNVPAKATAEHQNAHDRFGFCWKVFGTIDKINPFYGAAGRAVCVYFYPSAGQILHIVDHSTGQIIHKKPRAAVHTTFFAKEKERQIKVVYNKLAPSKLMIAVDPDQVGHRYSSRYDVDLDALLRVQEGESVHFGFFTEFVGGNPFDPNYYFDYDMKFAYTLPDFSKTTVFFEQTQSPLPHQDYTFLIRLKDEFSNEIFKSPLGLRVALLPVDDSVADESNPRARNFFWAERPDGYEVPELEKKVPKGVDSIPDLTVAPKKLPILITNLKITETGLYKATLRIPSPGRYRIMVQNAETSDRMAGYVPDRADKPRSSKWHTVRNSHIYVRNYYEIE